MTSQAHLPKAVLYYNPNSAWASAALLALVEKGYGEDELELRNVDLSKAENLSLTYLRINPNGTVPTLVVPLKTTLAPGVESRYKAITDTKTIVEFLDKSRSAISHTHTTSTAPAFALAPATIALSSTSSNIITLLHSEEGDPNILFHHNVFDLASLRAAAPIVVPYLTNRRDALADYILASQRAPISASEKTRELWKDKKAFTENLLVVYANASKDDAALNPDEKVKREIFFVKSKASWQVNIKKVLTTLTKEMIGPFALGDQLSLVDLHLAPWLARLAVLSGGSVSDDGDVIVAKLESKIGNNFTLPKDFQTTIVADSKFDASTPGAKRVKLAAFWDEMTIRPSWRKVYGTGLH